MFSIDFTFVWTAVNLAIIYFVVNKFLFKRLGAHMEKRANGIAADIEHGMAFKAESEQLKQQHETLVKEASGKQRAMLDEAKAAADKEYARIVIEAKQEATRIINDARSEISREREQMKRELSEDMVSLAIAAASRVMEANMDDDRNRQLVERFLSEEGAA